MEVDKGMNSDLEFLIEKGANEKQHFHSDIEIVFVIEGEAKVIIQQNNYRLLREDICLINSGIPHSISCNKSTITGRAYYSYSTLVEAIKNDTLFFICNSTNDDRHSYEDIRTIFKKLVYYEVQNQHKSDCQKLSLLYTLLDCVIENYSCEIEWRKMDSVEDNIRVQKIMQYVNRNFQRSINLSDLAEKMYVSASTISRSFKKYTGIYFVDYVNQVRVRYAVQLLIESKDNITQIALDSGFSSPSVFNRVFRSTYGVSPTEYRNRLKKEKAVYSEEKYNVKKRVLEELKKKEIFKDDGLIKGEINCEFNNVEGRQMKRIWNKVINIGSSFSLTLANMQFHTLLFKEKLDIQYVRIWNIFSEKLKITDGRKKGNYNYDMIDSVLDFLVSNQLHPFLDFGRRVNVAMESFEKSVYREEEYIAFQSREVWEDIFRDFLRHVVLKYGREEVSQWIFELSCNSLYSGESDCYIDENYNYFNVYKYVWKEVKSVLPEAKVGGPMAFGRFDLEFLYDFLVRCRDENCVPDFVSCALFPYEIHKEQNKITAKRTIEEGFEKQVVDDVRCIIKNVLKRPCELYITEWNCSISSRDYFNDSCFRAAYLAEVLSELLEAVDLFTIWVGSDWISNYYDTNKIANGGNGILTKGSIRKPVYFVLEFMNSLGMTLLGKNKNFIITKVNKKEYFILCFNFKRYGCNYFLKKENDDSPEIVKSVFNENAILEINLTFDQMEAERSYIIKKTTVNEKEGSILKEWEKFQYDRILSGGDVQYIRDMCFPRMYRERKKTTKDGKLKLKIFLQDYEIALFHVYENPY